MEIIDNCFDIFKFTYGWLRRREDLRLLGYLLAVFVIATFVFLIAAVLAFLGPLIVGSMGGSSNTAVLQGMGVVGIVLFVIIMLAYIFVLQYYTVLPVFSALRAKNMPNIDWTPNKFVGYILLRILEFVYAAFSILTPKAIPLVVAFYLALILNFAVPALTQSPLYAVLISIVTALLAIPYVFLVIYNYLRFCACAPIYLSKGTAKREALKESWALTQGNVIAVLAFRLGVGLAWDIVMWAVQMVFTAFLYFFMIIGFIAIMAGGLGFVILAAVAIVAMIVGLAISVFQLFISSYTSVGIYDKLLQEVGKPAASISSPRIAPLAESEMDDRRPARRRPVPAGRVIGGARPNPKAGKNARR